MPIRLVALDHGRRIGRRHRDVLRWTIVDVIIADRADRAATPAEFSTRGRASKFAEETG